MTETQPEPTAIPDRADIVFAIYDRLAEHGHQADVLVAPQNWDGIDVGALAELPNDEWPTDPDTAARVVLLVSGIFGCDADTALALEFNENGVPLARPVAGTSVDTGIATAIIARDIDIAPPVREPTELQISLDKLRAELFPPSRLVAANDNAGATRSAVVTGWPGIISSGDMISRFTPPDCAIDGIIQGFLYALTANTETGKTAILLALAALKAQGLPLGNRDMPQGRVVYFAGENPDDVVMRWIAAAHHAGFDTSAIEVHFVPGVFDFTRNFREVTAAVERVGGASMIIVDTSAAHFTGDDDGNVAMGKHARNLRQLTLPGSPAVLVACHPTKNADQANLLPRGDGAFIAEVDGNLTCQKTEAGTVKLHWQGKFRGPDFRPIHFDLSTVTAPGWSTAEAVKFLQ